MDVPEIELKFEVSDEALPRLSKHVAFAGPASIKPLRSIYFDTRKRQLRSAGLALRVRQSENGFIQNLKVEGKSAPLLRREWETPVKTDGPDAKALAGTPAEAIVDGCRGLLEPVFTTAVERTNRTWTEGENVVEVTLDRGEITSGNRREPIQEVELELKAGHPESLFELAAAVNEQVHLPRLFESKAERGYRLADGLGWEPQHAEHVTVRAETPAAEAFQHIGHSCLAQVANNARVLGRYRQLEALHQLRVGLRRLRAAMTTFRPFLEDGDYELIRAETKWLATELDAARDLDVFILESFRRVQIQADDREAFAQLGAQLLRAQTRSYGQALAALASPRFARYLLSASRWIEVGTWARSEEPVIKRLRERRADEFARERLDRMQRQVRKRGRRLASLDAQSRHRLRIKAKKLRYASEFFCESFGSPTRHRRFLKVLKDFQDGLGRLHDTDVAPQIALTLGDRESTSAGFAAGLIIAHRRASAETDERIAEKSFADIEATKPFWN